MTTSSLRIEPARELMHEFEGRTGVGQAARGAEAGRRYLWTDAFAVCTLLELHRLTGDERHLRSALALVDDVHRVLGRFRSDDVRKGWISGLGEADGARHPTMGGLRIGKPLPERPFSEPFDERLEWERDGQYFHYLTKWMHALARVAAATGNPVYLQWAVELAIGAHRGFTSALPGDEGARRMHWKMSTDLARPLVPAAGAHDPLDGLLTFLSLEAAAGPRSRADGLPSLRAEIRDMASMCRPAELATADPLGLGGLLWDALRCAELTGRGTFDGAELLVHLLNACSVSLEVLLGAGQLEADPSSRLAFRELGLSIGLHALPLLRQACDRWRVLERPEVAGPLEQLEELAAGSADGGADRSLAAAIERTWLSDEQRRSAPWLAHQDINDVMLATSLIPGGFLDCAPRQRPNG